MADNMQVLDARSVVQTIRTTADDQGVQTPHQKAELQVSGNDVSNVNPVPVTIISGGTGGGGSVDTSALATWAKQDLMNAALGTPNDGVWGGGAAPSGIVGILKAISAKLGALSLAAGSAVIGKVGLQVGGTDLAAGNPMPVSGKTGIQIAGADVANANPVPVAIISGGSTSVATTVNEGSQVITAGQAADVIAAGGSAVGIEFYNRGANDATYRVGATATGAVTERTLHAGESKRLPYLTALKLSVYSSAGTTIEWETWA